MDDIVLVNRTKTKAIGEALDLANSIPENSSISIKGTNDFAETKDSEVIVIAASAGTYSTSRTELVKDQVTMVRQILEKLKPFNSNSKILMASNPLDILTYIFQKEGNLPKDKVIGIASSLDSSRFRYLLSRELLANPSEISGALVLGEHGDSMVPVFSHAKKNQTPIIELLNSDQIQSIVGDLRFYWKILREYKSRSVFGISKHLFDVLETIIKNKEITIPSSVLLNGEYGITDVCIGVPTKISKSGLEEIQEINLESSELEDLQRSSEIVKKYIQDIYKQ